MKLDTRARNTKYAILEEATAAELETALESWRAARTEERIQGLEYQVTDGAYSVIIVYTE